MDNTDISPGKRYDYTAHVEQHGNPSYVTVGKFECARPSQPEALSATALNTTAIELTWSVSDGTSITTILMLHLNLSN